MVLRLSSFIADVKAILASPGPIGGTTPATGSFTGIIVAGAAATNRFLAFVTGAATRWVVGADPGTESGANAGSNFIIARYTDAGAYIDTPFAITRATGTVQISTDQAVAGKMVASFLSAVGTPSGANTWGIQQGGYIGWNYQGAGGETDFINSRGGGAGGFAFYNVDTSSTATPTLLMQVNGSGSFYALNGINGTAIGNITPAGGAFNGVTVTNAAGANFSLNANAGAGKVIYFNSANSGRWQFGSDGNAESGSNAGSNFYINRSDDSGGYLGTPFSISRATGQVQIANLTANVDSSPIGAVSPSTGKFTSLASSGVISATAPTITGPGQFWFSTTDGKLYVSVGTAWAEATSQVVPVATATTLGVVKVGAGLTIDTAGNVLSGGYDFGRNVVQNGQFTVTQRGVGPWTVGGYTADRWSVAVGAGGSRSVAINTATDALRTAVGDESMQNYATYTFTGGSGSTDLEAYVHPIENARLLAGKTYTFSFWAWAASGTPKMAIEVAQAFGSGGSPSAAVSGIGSTAITLSTTPTRYTVTVPIPSVAGKTFGTANDSCTNLLFWMSAGSSFATRAASIGVQSGAISVWGIQGERGAVTPLEKRPQALELLLCQRYYQIAYALGAGYGLASAAVYQVCNFLNIMRTTPTITPGTNSSSNVSGFAITFSPGNNLLYVNGSVTATGSWTVNCPFTMSAEQ